MIRAHLPSSLSFEPETIDMMSKALSDACIALLALGDEERRLIAERIIYLVQRGVVDPIDLRDTVLMERLIK